MATVQGLTGVRNQIAVIDREIDSVHRELQCREKIDKLSARSWQFAWDKNPDLRKRESSLFLRRGQAQVERAELEAALARRPVRLPRPKACVHCGGTGRARLAQVSA